MHIIGSHIIRFKSIDSTNDHAAMLIAKNNPIEGTVISADFQLKGKGQRNNKWQSEAASNLLFSIILRPSFLRINQQFYLSMFCANALVEVLSSHLSTDKLFIKWPNDIYYRDKKLAGMLIQNNLKGENIESTIIGIGLNVNQLTFDSELINPTSIALEKGKILVREDLLKSLLKSFDLNYQSLIKGQYLSCKNDFENKLYNKGILSTFKHREGEESGCILGVLEDGRLLVNIDGRIKKLQH